MRGSSSETGRDSPATSVSDPGPAAPPRVLAATLVCENCGRPTLHKILRWDPRSYPKGERSKGIARCRVCGWTHPFDLAPPAEVEVSVVVSRRSTSVHERLRLSPTESVEVGSTLPRSEPPLRVRRIDLRSGESAVRSLARDIGTLWVAVDEGLLVPVSIIEGARTRTTRWNADPGTEVVVGDRTTFDGLSVEVIALRAHGHTWRRPGDRFRASELQRIYGRRTAIPPAGRRDWSIGRERPRSRTRSFSRSSLSRSGPGVKRNRTSPRA